MPAKIDQNLIPPIIRDSIDPDILNRAQSIEWLIERDTGEDEHGFLDGSHEDYLSSQDLIHKTMRQKLAASGLKTARKSLELADCSSSRASGRDSGFDRSPTSPEFDKNANYNNNKQVSRVSSALSNDSLAMTNAGSLKRLPMVTGGSQRPFPMYKSTQGALAKLEGDDTVFEVAPRARPGEKSEIHEKSTREITEKELEEMGLDSRVFGPNTNTEMDEHEEETLETAVLRGGRRELEELYEQMRIDKSGYFDRQRARSGTPGYQTENSGHKSAITYHGSLEDVDPSREQEFYPFRDAQHGKPLPGMNEYGCWSLSNGQWVRAEGVARPKFEQYTAERVKCCILLEPPPPPVIEIKAEPIKPLYVEMKKPLELPAGDEEKLIEDPNLMWMHMGPLQYGPPFGTINKRKPREEEWVGPPCELCHKQIEERRCMLAENMKFHCWHFACSFCLKTLKPSDFLIAEADRKPYCLNCHKREFPEISLTSLKLEE